MRESYDKTRKLFVNTLKGKEDKFKQAINKGVKKRAINGLGDAGSLGAVNASLITTAMGFITNILGFFKGKKNPATGEEFTDENVTEGQIRDLLTQSEGYDEDGNPLETTANPNFWQKAGNFVNTASNMVSNFLPSGGGGGGGGGSFQQYDEYDDEQFNPQNMIISPASSNSSAVTANVMTGGMMSNIGNFIKKNAVMVGLGVAGIGAAVYFLTRKKKSKGLSGVSRRVGRSPKRRVGANPRGHPKRLKSIKLS
jgi:phosphotransferase system  glucose/maltose/N-acetylglucosamine-specific IIC component